MGLILNNARIGLRFGGPFYPTRTTPTFSGTPADFIGRARTLNMRTSLETVDTGGAGSFEVLNQYHSKATEMTLRGVLSNDDEPFAFATLAGGDLVGYNVEVTIYPDNISTVPIVKTGVIREFNYDAERNQEQLEGVRIDLNPDYRAA